VQRYEHVGSTGEKEPAAEKSEHWLIQRMGWNSVGSIGVITPDDPAKSKPTSVLLSRGTQKCMINTGSTDEDKTLASVQLSREIAK
jgi:hypothetical protein